MGVGHWSAVLLFGSEQRYIILQLKISRTVYTSSSSTQALKPCEFCEIIFIPFSSSTHERNDNQVLDFFQIFNCNRKNKLIS